MRDVSAIVLLDDLRGGSRIGSWLRMLIVVSLSQSADASTVVYSSLTEWEAAVGTVTFETFDGPGDPDFLALGFEFDIGSLVTGTWAVGMQDVPLNLTFNEPGTLVSTTVFGVSIVPHNIGLVDFRAFDGHGNQIAMVGNVSAVELENTPFVGFTSSDGIARIEIDHKTIGDVTIANLRFAAVAVPVDLMEFSIE